MDNRYNGFKELENSIAEGKSEHFSKVQNNLRDNKSTYNFIGNLVNLYLPQFMNVVSRFLGSEGK